MPSPRLAGLTASRSRPSRRMAPPLGSTKPAIICKVVVLPQPDGPSSETNSPFSTPSDSPSTASCVPNLLLSFSRSRNATSASVQAHRRTVMQTIEGVLWLVHFQNVRLRRAQEQAAQHAADAAMCEHGDWPRVRQADDVLERRPRTLSYHYIALSAARRVLPMVEATRRQLSRPPGLDLDAVQAVPVAP